MVSRRHLPALPRLIPDAVFNGLALKFWGPKTTTIFGPRIGPQFPRNELRSILNDHFGVQNWTPRTHTKLDPISSPPGRKNARPDHRKWGQACVFLPTLHWTPQPAPARPQPSNWLTGSPSASQAPAQRQDEHGLDARFKCAEQERRRARLTAAPNTRGTAKQQCRFQLTSGPGV